MWKFLYKLIRVYLYVIYRNYALYENIEYWTDELVLLARELVRVDPRVRRIDPGQDEKASALSRQHAKN